MGPARETKPRESEHEEEQEQEQEHMKGHKDPLCLTVGEWKFKRKDKQGQEGLSSDEERRLNYPPLKDIVGEFGFLARSTTNPSSKRA